MWIPEIEHHCPDKPFLIIGCKDDVRDELIWRDMKKINKLVHGYLSKHSDDIDKDDIIPLDIFGIIEKYLMENDMNYRDKYITDEEAQELCDKVGGHKYLSCSAAKLRGLDEIFDEVCKCCIETSKRKNKKRGLGGCKIL